MAVFLAADKLLQCSRNHGRRMNLKLLQLGDSALPIGGYSHSWGLEAAIDRGAVRHAAGLELWARSWLTLSLAPFEGVVAAASCRAAIAGGWRLVRDASDLIAASLAPPPLRLASGDMGEQLLALTESWRWAASSAAAQPWHHAVVFGVLAAAAGSEPREALAVFLHQAVLGIIGAGVRAIPIGHTHGQQVVASLHDDVLELAERYQARDLETAGSNCPVYEILCDEQSQLYTRIFRS
jgi:urease accessory protein